MCPCCDRARHCSLPFSSKRVMRQPPRSVSEGKRLGRSRRAESAAGMLQDNTRCGWRNRAPASEHISKPPGMGQKPKQEEAMPETQMPTEPQRLRALEHANTIRLARAALKRRIAEGDVSAADVILECPVAAIRWTISELLLSQRRWGSTRCRKFLERHGVSEIKLIGSLTERQRRLLADELGGCPSLAEVAAESVYGARARGRARTGPRLRAPSDGVNPSRRRTSERFRGSCRAASGWRRRTAGTTPRRRRSRSRRS